MKFTYLQSAEMPNIDPYVKECINSGQWFLFKAQTRDDQVSFFLKADKDLFALDKSGNVLLSIVPEEEFAMEEVFYFEDVPRPVSLSNQFVANY